MPSALVALFFPIYLMAFVTSFYSMVIFSCMSYIRALWDLNYSLIHFSFISAIFVLSLVILTSLHSILFFLASYQSCISAIGPSFRFRMPYDYEYLENFLTDLCHSLGFCLWFFFIISLSKNSFAIVMNSFLVLSGVHSTSFLSICDITVSILLGLYFVIIIPLYYLSLNTSSISFIFEAFTSPLSTSVEYFLICA